MIYYDLNFNNDRIGRVEYVFAHKSCAERRNKEWIEDLNEGHHRAPNDTCHCDYCGKYFHPVQEMPSVLSNHFI
jgi:hypothetical protein